MAAMLPSWLNFWSSSKPTDKDSRTSPDPSKQPPSSQVATQQDSTSQPSPLQPRYPDQSQPPQSPSAPRVNRGALLFTAGFTFSLLSLLVTRRSFARRHLTSIPPQFYTTSPSHAAAQASRVSGPLEALEALNIATINVLSFTMMAGGGTMWYLGIESVEDARRVVRGGLGVDGSGRSEREAEEDFEEWIASTLSRKEAKEKAKREEKKIK